MSTNASEEKKNIFSRMARSIKDMRGEMKRVVWPSRKQVINNTAIVIGFMVVAAIVVGGFDLILSAIIRYTLGA